MKVLILEPCSKVFDVKNGLKIVFAKTGQIYHQRAENGLIAVNFPVVGSYISNADVVSTGELLKFKTMRIPTKEKDYSQPLKFEVRNQKQLACIYATQGLICVSPEFQNLNYQFQQFIINHERGHLFYFSEPKCDLYATILYLKKGYNKSQIDLCLQNVLTDSSINKKRLQEAVEYLTGKFNITN